MTGSKYCKRLIEVDLPIGRISAHARREKAIRHGHISTLHIWFARRPLAACRAVTCAALWPDPADANCPQPFQEAARQATVTWAKENLARVSAESYPRLLKVTRDVGVLNSGLELRHALLDFIADFANWDNASDPAFVRHARLITAAAHEALGVGFGDHPLVFDPFAGGGSIPLEALRVGADAFASDLNPVPVLLNKFTIEYLPRYGTRLLEGVQAAAARIKERCEKELGVFYQTDEAGALPVAFLWARTIISEAPGEAGSPIQLPLLRTMWLSKRKDFQRALRWVRDAKGRVVCDEQDIELPQGLTRVQVPRMEIFAPRTTDAVEVGVVKGGAATCPVTGFTTSAARVKEQLKQQRGGADYSRLYGVYCEGAQGREFRISTDVDYRMFAAAKVACKRVRDHDPRAFPDEVINPTRPYKNTRGLSAVTRIGCQTFSDLYNARQLLSIRSFYEALEAVGRDLGGDAEFARAVATALALAINRNVSQNTSVSRWDASRLTIKGAFSKQALAVVWDFAEANPFSGGSADWDGAVEWVSKFIEANSVLDRPGTVERASATAIPLPADSAAALITDPPYFAAIPYADLSDFFYVWLARGMATWFPDLFKTGLTEKAAELVVTNAQKGPRGQTKDDEFFRVGMTNALTSAREITAPDGIGVIVYAEGTTAGWEAIIAAILNSGWTVTSSWPLDTEMATRTQAQGSASLQSSVHIVCRPKERSDGNLEVDTVGDWRTVLSELPTRIHEWLPRLAKEGVFGADAIFACLGPALEVFSKYARVERANGEPVPLTEYLEHVWATVANEALSMVLSSVDTAGLESDGRLTAIWLWTIGGGVQPEAADVETEDENEDEDGSAPSKSVGFALEYDAARKLAQGLGAHLEDLTQLVQTKGDTARLLSVRERSQYLFGRTDETAPKKPRKKAQPQQSLFASLEAADDVDAGAVLGSIRAAKTTLDRIHQSMILFGAGRGDALKRFLIDEGVGNQPQFWKLAQSLSALYPNGTEEKRWVDGVLARKKSFGFA